MGKIAIMMVAILTLGLTAALPIHAGAANALFFVNPLANPFPSGTPIHTRFNVTVMWLDTGTPKMAVFAWQIAMNYNSTLLNCTRGWQPVWDTDYIFYGMTTVKPSPMLETGSAWLIDSLYSGSGSGLLKKLAIFEMEIMYVPPPGVTVQSVLNINNQDSFWSPDGFNWPSPILIDGTYTYSSRALALSDFDAFFAANNVGVIYPSDVTPKPLGCGAAMVSDWTASGFVTTKLQTYTEGLDTNGNSVNQTSGKPLGAAGMGIVTFGGWGVNPVVKYAESSGTSPADRAPIKTTIGGNTVYFQYSNGSNVPGASISFSVTDHEDMFVIEVYKDGDGRNVMICYGVGWKGTYAAGKYFHSIIYPNRAFYNVGWVITKWQDTNGDSFVNNPGDGDTYTVIATGL
jgi:hypothetical protein